MNIVVFIFSPGFLRQEQDLRHNCGRGGPTLGIAPATVSLILSAGTFRYSMPRRHASPADASSFRNALILESLATSGPRSW